MAFAPARRQNGDVFVSGRIRYLADLAEAGSHHAFFVRSTVASGALDAVDTSAARMAPDVTAVLTSDDLSGLGTMPLTSDPAPLGGQNTTVDFLARDRVRYVGEPVAVVVARSRAAARSAAALVDVRITPAAAVLDLDAALAVDAPKLYDEWSSNVILSGVMGSEDSPSFEDEGGDDGLRHVSGVVEMDRSSTAALEPRGCKVRWDAESARLHWTGTTQSPHVLQSLLAKSMGLAVQQVHVVAPPQGGSFGVKQPGHTDEILIAAVARQLGIPISWEETPEERLLLGQKEQRLEFRAAFDVDGRVHSVRTHISANVGAVSASGAWIMPYVGALSVPAGYDIQDVSTEYTIAVSNTAPWASARPFGKEVSTLVMERVMDLVAQETGMDPIAVRRRNWIKPTSFPYDMSSGLLMDSGNYEGLASRLFEVFDRDEALDRRNEARASGLLAGIGYAFEVMPESGDAPGQLGGSFDTCTVRMDQSGHVAVVTGVTSPGNGNETGLAQIVASELGVSVTDVRVLQGDTDTCTLGGGNFSSRSIVVGGAAAHLAAQEIATRLRAGAASMLHCDPEDIDLGGGMAVHRGRPDSVLPISVVADSMLSLNRILAPGIEPGLEVTRTFTMPNVRHLPDERGRTNIYATYPNALYVCEVEVDAETGVVTLRRHAMAHDCGTVVNQDLVDGQFRGGVVMGIGEALYESLPRDAEGASRAKGFKTYLLPRAVDIPPFVMVEQCTPSPFSPFGAKGAGESGVACATAAVLNAINDALSPVGAQLTTLPALPHRVLESIQAAGVR